MLPNGNSDGGYHWYPGDSFENTYTAQVVLAVFTGLQRLPIERTPESSYVLYHSDMDISSLVRTEINRSGGCPC